MTNPERRIPDASALWAGAELDPERDKAMQAWHDRIANEESIGVRRRTFIDTVIASSSDSKVTDPEITDSESS